MVERVILLTLGLIILNPVSAEDHESNSLDMGLIEFLGEGKKVDGEWVDPMMLGDEPIAGSEEQNHE